MSKKKGESIDHLEKEIDHIGGNKYSEMSIQYIVIPKQQNKKDLHHNNRIRT